MLAIVWWVMARLCSRTQHPHCEPLCRQPHRIAQAVLYCVFGSEAFVPSGKLGHEPSERDKEPV